MTQVNVPDIGDFKDVEVIDVLVKPGDSVELETPLVTLETEKATMDVPSSAAGVVKSVALKKGDRVSKGSLILEVEAAGAGASSSAPAASKETAAPKEAKAPAAAAAKDDASSADTMVREKPAIQAPAEDTSGGSYDYDMVVLGAGPGGYTAAFRAADLGMKVALVERWPQLGGVCLNVGCIPSKALLHAAKVIEEAHEMEVAGVTFGKPKIDTEKLRGWKEKVVSKLTGGLGILAKQRKVEVIRGIGKFVSPHEMSIANTDMTPQSTVLSKGENAPGEGARKISFKHCIIAAGSESVRLPGLPDDPRIIDSTGALEIDLPKRMLVIGGGIIGLEMACVYDALGTKVSVVELTDGLIPGCDRDLVRPLEKRIAKRYEKIMVKTKVTKLEALKQGIRVTFEGEQAPEPQIYDKVLVAVGRSPNGKKIGAEAAGVVVNERGFIPVDKQMRTNVSHIFAIGDIVGQPMLAHKASHEGKLAAEVAQGEKRYFDARVIPSVAYTDPEIAWVGVTETEAKAKGIPFEKGSFPWSANARSLTLGRDDGMTKVLFDPETHRVIGGGIVGPNAGDLISEIALAIEMNSDAGDLGMTIHPHPTLSETVMFSAEAFEGTLTDLYVPKKTARAK
ncbi:dihydrolipoyl dehydrogenase [Steroidobacter sp. S1-65]|uniref:Dihydrolipoyl dehydrogenase n=1 Tax=Steroidobacter gossypii TaxID=2805490 RepID=A0ABS1X5Z9_9GAMM|nr:dihydrolipoyl dehydrogenase [Steroidobacter gossypii]